MSGPILVATHTTPDAELVVGRAARLAVALGVGLHGVSVVENIEVGVPVGAEAAARIAVRHEQHRNDAAEALRRADTVGRSHGLELVPHLVQGEPAAHIVSVADEIGAALIVIGSSGLDAAGRYILGSVPERVLFDAHGHDVLVVRTTDRRRT